MSGTNTSVGTATVMFTDLVGSTELRSRVGEEVADALRALHDAVLIEAIGSNDGRVVKHLGDGMMATFASAANGVAAAVAIQQGLDLGNRRSAQERMQVRIGISVGDVTFDGDDLFGLPVVEAQRLEASAEPSTIRCAEMVMLMARGRGGHEFTPLGELELKGLAEPIAASEVRWSPVPDAPDADLELGLPPVFAHGSGLPFSGRDDVFEQLVDAWKRCAAGGFEVVLLAGEPGIGKTRLAQEVAARVHGGDGVVLGGRSDEDVSVPFQAFGAALDWFVRQTPPDQRLGRLGEFPGDLIRLVPELGRLVADLPAPLADEPEVERYRLFQAVGSWLSFGDAERPRLLVLDDLHWADKPTLLLLRHLISNAPTGLMVLCTYRDTDVDRTHPLSSMLADFRRMPSVSRIGLDGLGDDGVRDLLVRTGGHDLDHDGLAFAELVQRETSGNPFFVGEVLRHLAETGALVQRDGRWTSDLQPEETGIPEGIREVVGRRLSRLGDDVEGVLRSAAVIGYEFDVDLLADVVGRDVDDVLDALDIAAAANLVIEIGVDRHRFAHALVRETLHSELSSSRRARQHRKVAQALEARHADDLDSVITGLATHWAEASAGGDPTRAIELAIRAGDVAAERGAVENAAGWFARALDLLEDEESDDALVRTTLVKLAQAQVFSGSGAEGMANARNAARAALAAGDVGTAVDAALVSARMSFDSGDPADPERVDILREVLQLRLLDVVQRAELLGALATELIFERDIAGRAAVLEERDSLMAELPPAERVRVGFAGGGLHRRDDVIERLDILLNTEWGSATEQFQRSVGALNHALMLGDRPVMDSQVVWIRGHRESKPTTHQVFSLLPETVYLTVSGQLAEAARLRQRAVEGFVALGAPEAVVYRATTSMALAREDGRVADLAGPAEVMETVGHPAGAARAMAAFIHFVTGELDRVSAALDLVEGEEFAEDAGYPVVVALWCEVVAGLRSRSHCRRLLDQLEPQTGLQLLTGGILFGAADRLRALLHDVLDEFDRADALFAAALEQHTAMASPPWIARTELDWAESLLRRNRVDDAVAHVEAARGGIGDLELPDNQRRLDELTARLPNA